MIGNKNLPLILQMSGHLLGTLKKAPNASALKAFSVVCSHQGMILGPPDYESGALTN